MMSAENVIDFKRGDTFELGGQALDANDDPVDLTSYTIKAQIRDKYKLVGDAVVTKVVAANGEYKARINNTILWPVKRLSYDVQFTDSTGYVESTETIIINCVEDVSQ